MKIYYDPKSSKVIVTICDSFVGEFYMCDHLTSELTRFISEYVASPHVEEVVEYMEAERSANQKSM